MIRRLLCAAQLLVIWIATCAAIQAQEAWIEWKTADGGNGHWYALTAPMTWTAAEERAVNLGGHLASIADQAEDDFVRTTVCNGAKAWAGLDLTSTNWTDGSAVTYWASPVSVKTLKPIYVNGSSGSLHWVFDTAATSRQAVIELPASPDVVRPKLATPAITWYQWPTNYGGNGHWYGICEAGQTNAGSLNTAAALGATLVSFENTNETAFAFQITHIAYSPSFFRTGLSAAQGEPYRWPDGSIVGDELPAAKGQTNAIPSLVRYCLNYALGLAPLSDQGVQLGSLLEITTHPTNLPPALVQYPSDQEVLQGSQSELWAFAVGAEPMRYQWKVGGADLPGETNRSLTLQFSTVSTGAVTVVASNPNGVVESAPAKIDILPVLNVGPFVWIERPSAIGGNDHWYASLPIPSGLTWSNAFDLSIRLGGYLPTFTSHQEADRFAKPWPLGAVGDFWLGLTDADSEGVFNWIDGSPLTEPAWNTNEPIGQPDGSSPDKDYVFASQGGSQSPFSWRVTINDFKLTWLVVERDSDPREMAAAIVDLSTNIQMRAGASNQLEVIAGGAGELSYQWQRNGSPVLDATNSVLRLESATLDQSGLYTVVITNAFGSITSAPVSLTVFIPRPPKLTLTIAERSEDGHLRLRLEHDFPDDAAAVLIDRSSDMVNWWLWSYRTRDLVRYEDIWIDPSTESLPVFFRARRNPE